ncbi:MAG: PucR family transcriptional regulator ligand-binding domain-containing protein [Solirubrobacterales bacterium]|nr:PucR family transcriptional regulator ligand-binding domain-containing protein [Solirubrobacterales bacterium]
MAITVRELLAIPDLRTWARAGEAGLDREIAWAHVCELPDPTEWLGEGDLVLTTGLGIPQEADAQRRYIERLADAGLRGVSIGDHMYAPPLTPEMEAAANERALPLLFTAYEVPFSAVARAVVEANRSEEHARLLGTLRLYETVRHASVSASGADLLAQLGRIVGCDLYLIDHKRGLPLIAGSLALDPEIVDALLRVSAERSEPMPAVLRLKIESGNVMALAVPASRPATMVVLPRGRCSPELGVLRHVASVAALELEREAAERERLRHLGAEMLAGLVDGRLTPEGVAQLLAERQLDREPRVIAACHTDAHNEVDDDLHVRLDQRGIPHLLLRRRPLLIALLLDSAADIAGFREEVNPATAVGLSGTLGRLSRAPDAEREARWALEAGEVDRAGLVRYGEHAPSLFLPRGLSEADRAVRDVLGALLDYDRAHHGELVKSLRTFLSHNRSWKDTAAELHVHKQTLVYRMRRVEELTGRRLDETGDVAELWFALKAGDIAAPSRASAGDLGGVT